MKLKSQIAILKTIVKWQAEEIEALEKRVKGLDEWLGAIKNGWSDEDRVYDELTGSIGGTEDVKLRVQIQTPEEHAWAKLARAGKPTATRAIAWEECGR